MKSIDKRILLLRNKTTGKIISHNLIVAKTIAEKTVGLLNKSKRTSIFFKTRWGVHTFGMKYPIDIVVTDSTMKVVAIRKKLTPNRIFFWNPKYDNIFELPANNSLPISLNDVLIIQN